MFEIKPYLSSEFCLQCRGCCSFTSRDWLPHLLDFELESIGAAAVRLKKERVCEFLKEENHHCLIYAKRPFECRLYPFLINRRQNSLDLVAHLACPFVLQNLTAEHFKEYVFDLSGILKQPAGQIMLRDNFAKFHGYPEVELLEIERDILRKE